MAQQTLHPATNFFGRHGRFWIIGGLIAIALIVFVWLLFQPAKNAPVPNNLRVGQAAPDFTLTAADGSRISLASLRSHPVIINFWSTSCDPCRSETPLLQRTFQQYQGQGLQILGVDQGEPQDAVTHFQNDYALKYHLLLDTQLTVNKQYSVTALPVTYFVDTNGIIRYAINPGVLTATTLKAGLAAIGLNDTSTP